MKKTLTKSQRSRAAPKSAWRAASANRGRRRAGRADRRRRNGRGSTSSAALAAAVQNSRSHQAPAGSAGAGCQRRARQQGGSAHDLPFAGWAVLGFDAQHRARRRHFPQNHQCPGPQPIEGDCRRTRRSRRHGRYSPHGWRFAYEGRGQARLRIFVADVGNRARDDARVQRADARLRRRLAHQAGDPRSLQQRG